MQEFLVRLPAVQLFAGKLDPPRDLLLFPLLGCENILVFVVSQKKTENFGHLGACPMNFINFVRSTCNEDPSPRLKR